MKYIHKEIKPLKNTMKDTAIVGFSSFICIYIYFQYKNTILEKIVKSFGGASKVDIISPPEIFTDNPGF